MSHRKQQRRLSHARLTGEKDDATGHGSATEDAIELTDAGRDGMRRLHPDVRDRLGCGGRGDGRGPANCAEGGGLIDRSPRLALPAATHPFGGRPPALRA
jgi:hypothetical protein